MESGDIADKQITASSENSGLSLKAPKARLNSAQGSWFAGTHDVNQWIQVNFDVPHVITGVILQGRCNYPQWVKTYKVEYYDGFHWQYILDDTTDGAQEFDGNTDKDTPMTTYFDHPIKARYIRIRPHTWNGAVTLRFELLGCEDTKPFSIVVPAGEGYVVGEADSSIEITITRTCLPNCPNAGVIAVNTADYTATASSDYTSFQNEPVHFMPATTDATVSLSIVDDVIIEPDESLVVYLAINVTGEIYHGSFTYITITDNDV
ncbi:retinoschisin-like [Amphiura filiformis]|uniref:retinoschisin-like n=1 Tax=Amphiura filiformis TaxID=82378 RepID=UPI003B228D61